MQHFQQHRDTKQLFLDLVIIIISLLALMSPLLLFGTRETNVSCVRSITGIECRVVGHALFFKSRDITIHNPIAVDLVEGGNKSGPNLCLYSNAEAKFQNNTSKMLLVSGTDCASIRAIARELDTFLHSPDRSFYHGKYP